MPSLVIVESPAKAKTISRFLGPNYRVEASFGHVRDLPESAAQVPEEIKGKPWGRMAVDVEGDFTPYYVIPPDKKKQITALRAAMKGAKELLLATDEDREGESIGWHLVEILKPKIPVRRIVFHEITEEAIREAVANPREIDERLVRAQESRRILDRLFGYSLSPLLWKKVQSGLSAGRVQSVAVRLLVEREEERRAFRSAVHWGIDATISGGGVEFKAGLGTVGGQRIAEGRDFDPATGQLKTKNVLHLQEADAGALVEALRGALPWTVSGVEEKPAQRSPAAPFTTSTLQQEASRKLGYGAKRTMRLAQNLYEGIDLGGGESTGLITYMRTDSTTLSERAIGQAGALIRKMYGDDFYKGPRAYATKTRNAQEAHEAIRPTDLSRKPADLEGRLEGDEWRLYDLVWKRTVASQMANAELMKTSLQITAKTPKQGECVFETTGTKILFPGFLRAYVEGSDDPAAELGDQETVLPNLKRGDRVAAAAPGAATLNALEPRRRETQPPARYTEAALVKKLEEEGIGRPSTYASIIETIQDRGYAFKKDKALVPTYTAFAVTILLREHFGDYVDIGFTAKMEDSLDEIASGEREWHEFVGEFFRGEGRRPGLERKIEIETEKIEFPSIDVGVDPKTKQPIRVRIGRYGPYLQRGKGDTVVSATLPQDLPPADLTAAQAAAILDEKAQGPRVIGVHPRTQENVYAANGRFGPYVQLGEGTEDVKPRRASLPRGAAPESVTLDEAVKLLELPRDLGMHPERSEPVTAAIGRYGPYVKCGDDFRSLEESDDVYTISFERALALFAAPKKARGQIRKAATALHELGADASGAKIKVMDGRYGPYVTDGKTNATLPKGTDPASVTMDVAKELIAARAAKGPPAKGRRAGRAGAKSPKAPKAT